MSGTASTYVPKSRVAKWFEARLPIAGLVHSSFIAYPVPRNLNYFWTFGAILAAFLGIQIITGVWLAMHYEPSATGAFTSVEKEPMCTCLPSLKRCTLKVPARMRVTPL